MTPNFEIELNDHDFHRFRELIYQLAGISLSDRKRELVKARLARRLRALGLDTYSEYYDLLQNPKLSGPEHEHFINALTTNKTEFYREPHHFQYLKEQFLPALRMATLSGRERKVRIWCAASSTGQEPYTLALSLIDYFGPQCDWDLRILASDIDTQVLATATAGSYPEAELDPVPAPLRSKYFKLVQQGENTTYTAKEELKRLLTFRQINLNEPVWPINIRFDAIFCRNVMIYFDQQTQAKLIEHFTQHLSPGGLLVIGHSESLFSITDDYESLGDTIYRVKNEAVQRSMSRGQSAPVPNRPVVVSPVKQTATRDGMAIRQRAAEPALPSHSHDTVQADSPLARYADLPMKSLIVGQYEATRELCILKTTIGSCIAACLFDAKNGIGGMNHFMLPQSSMHQRINTSYGVHAMELLINALMNLGASRRQLAAKIFGGAQVMGHLASISDVGGRNIQFVREFLDTEKIPILAQDVGGHRARQVHFLPTNAKAFIRFLDDDSTALVDSQQDSTQTNMLNNLQIPPANLVTWFTNIPGATH